MFFNILFSPFPEDSSLEQTSCKIVLHRSIKKLLSFKKCIWNHIHVPSNFLYTILLHFSYFLACNLIYKMAHNLDFTSFSTSKKANLIKNRSISCWNFAFSRLHDIFSASWVGEGARRMNFCTTWVIFLHKKLEW